VLNIIRKDWMMKWYVPMVFMICFVLLSLVVPEAELQEVFIFGLMWATIIPMTIWGMEEKFKGRTLLCSLPIKRDTFVCGTFISGLTFMLVILLSMFLSVQLRIYFSEELSSSIQEILQLKVFLSCLWIQTIAVFLYYVIFTRFNSGVATVTIVTALFAGNLSLKFIPRIFSGHSAPGADTAALGLIDRGFNFIFQHDITSVGLLISFVLIVFVNFLAMKLSEFLFSRNDIVT